VRTLRELGLDLATIRRLLDQEADLRSVAARHAEAIGAQIRVLRVQRAVLRALAKHEPTPQEVDRMNRIARATAEERRRIIAEFFDSVFEGIPVDPEFEGRMRSAAPELPDEPTDVQVDAWLELHDLVSDPDFRPKKQIWATATSAVVRTAAPAASPVRCCLARLAPGLGRSE